MVLLIYIQYVYLVFLLSYEFCFSVQLNEVKSYIDVHEKKKRVAYAIAYKMGIEWQLVLNIEQCTKRVTNTTDTYIGVYLFAVQKPVKIQ